MLLASLFRNFLLAQRVMARSDLIPASYPPVPPMHRHALWDAWDLAAEAVICELLERVETSAAPCPQFALPAGVAAPSVAVDAQAWLTCPAVSAWTTPRPPLSPSTVASATAKLQALLLRNMTPILTSPRNGILLTLR